MDLSDTRTRTLATFAAGAATASLLAGVLVLRHGGDDGDLNAQLASERTVVPVSDGPVDIPAAGAGTVTIDGTGDALALVEAAPEAGWTVTRTRQEDDRVRVEFQQGTERVRVEVRQDDGNLETRVDERGDAASTSTTLVDGVTTSTTIDDDDDDDATTPTTIDDDGTTPTTIDDDDDDDDNSGPGGGGDDRHGDDHSGPGGGGDDD